MSARAGRVTHLRVLVRTVGRYVRTRWIWKRGDRRRWPETARGCPRGMSPNFIKEHQEVGEIGGSFSGTVKPIVSLPMVVCCGRLVVVSSIPPGVFFVLLVANLLFFGAGGRAARDFGPPEKATEGDLPIGL